MPPMIASSMPTRSKSKAIPRKLWLALPTLLVAILILVQLFRGSGNPSALHMSGSVTPSYSSRHLPNPTAKNATQHFALTVTPSHLERQFAPGAVGLSVETNQLATQNLDANHKSLVELMRRLGPGTLRIGGDSLDYSWWTSDGELPPAWATSIVTPADLVTLRALLAATGWRAILGIDLGHFEPSRAANEALVATDILGSRLLGLEIGNEPDAYADNQVKLRPSSYGVNNYLEELTAYSKAIHTVAPTVDLYGPDLSSQAGPGSSSQEWLSALAQDKSTPLDAITQHYYPTSYSVSSDLCKGSPLPTALDLLSPQVREQENTILQTLVDTGQMADRETRITETNTTSSCDISGGPDTSPVFASALWSLDWILRSVSAGVAGLNFHGNLGICAPDTFSPICAPSKSALNRGQVTARPEYYGLLAARKLEGGYFVPVRISGQYPLEGLTAYATVHPHNVITLAIDNFATEGQASLILRVPGYEKAVSESLVAPSVNATNGVTFGRASLNSTGVIRPTEARLPRVDGTFQIKLAPTSAVIIKLQR
jgi:hypothetical protein